MRNLYWWLLIGLFIGGSILFLTYGVESHYWLIIKLRLVKWWGLVIVGVAIGSATLLFQTLTQNDILTPNIIGFDALFILLQTLLVFVLGGAGFISLSELTQFSVSMILMSVMALLLFAPLIRQLDLTLLILVGVIFSVLFRTLASFLQRIIAPEDFLVLQSELFASFNAINTSLLSLSSVFIIAVCIIVWQMRFVLDVMMLGRQHAIGLGINYQQQSYIVIALIAILVATATALVGPMSFLGLLVVALSNQLVSRMHHTVRIPVVMLVSGVVFLMLLRKKLSK